MRIFITGSNGFVGKYLIRELLTRGHKIIAGVRNKNDLVNWDIEQVYLDLLNPSEIKEIIKDNKPDGVIHLAAQSNVKESWNKPEQTFLTNTVGTINLVQAIVKNAPYAKVITVGSSEEYGLTSKEKNILSEELPCRPQNPYAVSKFAMGQAAIQLAHNANINLIHTRPFNHFGPGQSTGYVVSDFAYQIALI